MSGEELSDEQRARIEANREKALALRRQKQQLSADKTVDECVPASESFTDILERPAFPRSSNDSLPSTSSNSGRSSSVSPLKSKYWHGNTPGTDIDSTPPSFLEPTVRLPAKCVLTANYRFNVYCGYKKELIDVFRSVRGGCYKQNVKQLAGITFKPLPSHIITEFGRYISGASPAKAKPEFDLKHVDETLRTRLFPFQMECVNFAISKGGRVLIADDMGLGKTVEALAIISYYRDDWPALVICPASLRYTWKHAIMEWLPSVKEEQVAVFDSRNDLPTVTRPSTVIAIVSYSCELLKKEPDRLRIGRKFDVLILDESHFIKNEDTIRTKACQQLAKTAKRVILLSGTPALSRPKELYTQISAVRPQLFRSIASFGSRYCNPQPKIIRTKRGTLTITDYSGNENMEELEALLKETLMIRRVKEDVLNQLPPKVRGIVLLDSRLVKIDKKMAAISRGKLQDARLDASQKKSAMFQFFAATATAKLKAVTEYILDLLAENKKFLVFAHHHVMLDHLHQAISDKDYDAIRIDGATAPAERQLLCDEFQTNDSVRVALLSITAAGTGLTLTAAKVVVFAELFWNPGVLAQAEDRAHRVGQSDCVHVQYLVAEGTADDFIWPLVQKKLDILNKGGLSKGAFETAEMTRLEPIEAKPQQTAITEFMESLCIDVVAHDEPMIDDEDLFNQDGHSSKRQRVQ